MAKVGYIYSSGQHDTFATDKTWMEEYGCCRIIEEDGNQERRVQNGSNSWTV